MIDPKKELNDLIEILLKEGGSDLHLGTGSYPVIRTAGALIPLIKRTVLTQEDTVGIIDVLLPDGKKQVFFKKQEVDFSYNAEQGIRFRGNAFYQQQSIGISLRLIPARVLSLQELNLPSILEIFARMQQGFFLVVGPVGHGKSTTLAALIDLINKERTEHIITIEDPIEYVFKQERSIINQREVGVDTKDFPSALRSTFRQDVDVIMIGEMRGPETISTAVTASETGHLVFSTLHTNNASQTIDRIIDSFSPEGQGQIRAQLSQSLVGIFSQRLIPRVSGGLIPAYELLINNNAVSNLIREGRTHEINVVIETGSADGMINMNSTLVELVRKGEITPETANAHSLNPKGLKHIM